MVFAIYELGLGVISIDLGSSCKSRTLEIVTNLVETNFPCMVELVRMLSAMVD